MHKLFQNTFPYRLLFPAIGILLWTAVPSYTHAGGYDFRYLFRALPSFTIQEPAESTQNPGNNFLLIPERRATLDLRLDLNLSYSFLDLVAKPRLNLDWEKWGEGILDGDSHVEDRWFFYEYLARAKMTEALFFSVGKEFLQWGPSYTLSPSNPFFRDNGLTNPKREIQGKGFSRLVWVPDSSWTVSLIGNIFDGRRDETREEKFFDDFEPAYAVKLDYTGYRKYFSLIPSYKEAPDGEQENEIERIRLGALGGWTVSDALLLYAEGTGFLRDDALYPVQDEAASPYGIEMRTVRARENSFEGIMLLGASYTLKAGPTFTLEYVYNGAGYDEGEADLYYKLRSLASNDLTSPEPLRSLSVFTLSRTLDPGLRLLRRNYAMLQYMQVQIADALDVILRYTYNLDDDSSQFNPIVEYYLNDYVQLFLVGAHNFGSEESEFKSAFDYSWMFGLEVSL